MSRQQRKKSKSGYYHVMLRGNERRNIFQNDEDKLRFIETLYEKKQENRFSLHAFCLMDNHVHLMLSEGIEDVAKVMKRISVSYVYYFNKKYKRVGHLFQDRFKSEVVEDDSYVLALARYIHQNPEQRQGDGSFVFYANTPSSIANQGDQRCRGRRKTRGRFFRKTRGRFFCPRKTRGRFFCPTQTQLLV